MSMSHLTLLSLLSATLAFSAARAAEEAPAKPIGVQGMDNPVGLVDLAAHNIPGSFADYDLRSRRISIAPGGAVHNHPHMGRPGIVLVTKGTVSEYRGGSSRTLQAGDSWQENSDTLHWFRNPSSTEVAEIWAVDLQPKKK